MEIGMLNFWLGLLVTALMKETYFRREDICRAYEEFLLNRADGTYEDMRTGPHHVFRIVGEV
jgi:hypothetical protein